MLDIMIDLETMGTKPNSPIVSFGAAQFNIQGEIGNTIYRVIDLSSSLQYCPNIQGSTVYWWLQQEESARLALIQDDNRETLLSAMTQLQSFLIGCGNTQKLRLWGNGPTFDNAMIRYAYEEVMGMPFPIPFWNDRCVRTIKGFIPFNMFRQWTLDNQRKGTYHNALDDAKYQIQYVTHILREVGCEELY